MNSNRARIIIDLAGNARFYQTAPMPGWEMLGTVTRNHETGALVRNKHTGIYAMANVGALRSLDQRKTEAALNAALKS